MERLTFDGNFCDISQCRELPCQHGGSCTQRKVWERLKAYEDTWLTPEEVNDAVVGSKLMAKSKLVSAFDVAPVVHGRWIEHEETQEDAYSHHKCSKCNVNAPFYYKMREDWDEGMDGEWYSLGLVDDGINEYLTDYCPNCGARMDGDSDAKEN